MNLLDLLVKIGVDDQASEKIAGVAAKAKGGFAAVGKAAGIVSAAVGAVAGSAVVAIGKQALDSYAEFEQLEGGIDKLYGVAGKSRKQWIEESDKAYEEANAEWMAREEAFVKVSQNAQQAFRTAGMSANEYMETATSFSASLINSLGGDTVKAAEYTDVAIRAMSDNVNTFGSNAEDVKNAIMGISRENYTMVDNLKLGYAGTKEGFSQLIDDANAYAESIGQVGDLQMGSFADAIRAIELIQEKQQIAGTTGREAGKTIEGSVNAAKAAWTNLVTEFGKSEGDISARVSDLITSIFGDGTEENLGVIGNIGPRIVTIVENIIDAIPMIIEQVTPYLEQIQTKFEEFVNEHQEEFKQMGEGLWNMLIEALANVTKLLFEAFATLLGTIILTLPQWGPELLKAAVVLFVNILQGIGDTTVAILDGVAGLIGQAIATVTGFDGNMLEAAQELWHKFCDGVDSLRDTVVNGFWGIVNGAIENLTGFANDAYNVGSNILQGIVDGITSAPGAVLDAIWGNVNGAIETVKGWLGIASPSKLMAEIGKNTMAGFTEGIDSESEGPEQSMMDMAGRMSEMLENSVSTAIDAIRYYTSSAAQAGQDIVGSVATGISNDSDNVSQEMGSAVSSGVNVASAWEYVDALTRAGADVIAGFTQGIANNIYTVTDVLWGGVDSAISTVKGWLGIASPSKLFAEIGRYTMEGFALGIDDEAKAPERAMLDAAESIYGAASGSVDFGVETSKLAASGQYGALGGVQIIINDPVITEKADVDEILAYAEAKIRRRVGQWNPSLSMALS